MPFYRPLQYVFVLIPLFLLLNSSEGAVTSIRKESMIRTGESRLFFQSTNWILSSVLPLRDGTFFVGAESFGLESAAFKITALGTQVWSRVYGTVNESFYLREILERPDQKILSLFETRLIVLAPDGTLERSVELPRRSFSKMMRYDEGYLLAAGGADNVFIRKLSLNLETEYDIDLYVRNAGRVLTLNHTRDGGFIFSTDNACGLHIVKVSTNHLVQWDQVFRGADYCDLLSDLHVLSDGSVLLAARSRSGRGYSKTVDHFGEDDYWFIKLDANGNIVWQRSYGGSGYDSCRAILPTSDGGFMLAGGSTGSGITGNKTVDGDGIWLVKTDSRGIKMAEAVFPGRFLSYHASANQFDIFTYATNSLFTNYMVNVSAEDHVRLSVASTNGRPFNVDTSTNLSSWTRVITELSGNIELSQPATAPKMFYRFSEP